MISRKRFLRRILAGVAAAQLLGVDILGLAEAAAQEALPVLEQGGWYRLVMIYHGDGTAEVWAEDAEGRRFPAPEGFTMDTSSEEGVTLTFGEHGILTLGKPDMNGSLHFQMPVDYRFSHGIRTMAEMEALPHA